MKNLLPRDVTLTVIYHSERLCLEESPPKRAYCEGSLTFGLSASVNFIFSFRASAVPEQECFVRHLAWCRFDKTYFCAGAAVKNFSLHVHARRPAKQFRWRILLYTRIAVKERTSPLFLCGKEERFICLLRFYMISSFPYRR